MGYRVYAEQIWNKRTLDMIYGYLRVSSDEQDVNSQRQGVDAFAAQNNWTIDKYITDEGVSGGKDPDKRNLGKLMKLWKKGDIIICSEISRLGRDLYMVMDILHFAMAQECIIYTVKDKFILGNDIQSKVLAFAFGLSAEIERQMIQQRTKEGLRLRMKLGVLVGRPPGTKADEPQADIDKEKFIEQYRWGVPERRLAQNFGIDRNTVQRWLHRWGVKASKRFEREEASRDAERKLLYKEDNYRVIKDIDRDKIIKLITLDLTIPQIAEQLDGFTYEEVYDTILCDDVFNPLYRKHGQLKVRKKR
jgi:DNA invertase Pin-like site-specific DNA recombinase